MVGVPVMTPVRRLMESPAARCHRPNRSASPSMDESEALMASGVMAVPETSDWGPGLVTDKVLVTVQAKVACPLKPALSVAVTVTEQDPAVVGVPVMEPVDELIESPAGRPVAD